MSEKGRERGRGLLKPGIRLKLIILVIGILVLVFGIQTHSFIQEGEKGSKVDAHHNAKTYAELSHLHIIQNYNLYGESGFYKFSEIVKGLQELSQDVTNIRIVNMDGEILFDTEEIEQGALPDDEPDRKLQEETLLEKAQELEPTLIEGKDEFTIIQPHVEEWGRHKYSVIYTFSYESAEEYVNTLAQIVKTGAGLSLLLAVALISILASILITKPISKLAEGMEDMKKGRFHQRVDINTHDEIGDLAKTFNRMADIIQKSRKKLENYNKDLKQEVDERTHQLTQKVSELKKAKKHLKESEKKFKSYVSSSPEGIFVVDKRGNYTYVNEAGCKMFGYSKEEILAANVRSFTAESHQKEAYESFKELKKTGKLSYEGPIKRKDGKTIRIQINGVSIPGEGHLAFVTDITKEKENQKKLRQSEKKFKDIFNNANDAIFIHDFTPRFKEVNKVACDRLGYTRRELLKLSPKKIDAPDNAANVGKWMQKIRKEGKATFETVHVAKDGKRIPVEITSTYIEFKGKPAVISSARDITERKRLEKERAERADQLTQKVFELEKTEKQLKKAKKDIEEFNKQLEEKVDERTKELRESNKKVRDLLETKTQFVNQVAHDLRTPLTPISVLLPAVKKEAEGKLSDDDMKKLDVVINNAKYLTQLVSDTLDIARLDAGRANFNLEPLKLKDVTDEVINNNQVVFNEKGVEVQNDITDELPQVKADKVKLIEVFENIIMNATKFMTGDEKKLTFEAKKGKQKVTVRVSDTGIGIKKEDLKKIFDEFHKVDAARHEQSSGLGLAICKRIIQEFGGTIWAESDGEGKGATIAFTLPTTKPKEE